MILRKARYAYKSNNLLEDIIDKKKILHKTIVYTYIEKLNIFHRIAHKVNRER